MASAQVVETSVANNSPNSHDSNHPDEAFNFQFEKTKYLFGFYEMIILQFDNWEWHGKQQHRAVFK